MIKARTCKEKEYIITRTKNIEIVKIYRKLYGDERISFLEESAYENGKVYLFQTKIS